MGIHQKMIGQTVHFEQAAVAVGRSTHSHFGAEIAREVEAILAVVLWTRVVVQDDEVEESWLGEGCRNRAAS